jgi:hypothetical protein
VRRRQPGGERRVADPVSRVSAPRYVVVKTSWLAKPSRSSAAGRSSFSTAPTARWFFRRRISSASRGPEVLVGLLGEAVGEGGVLVTDDRGEGRRQRVADAGVGVDLRVAGRLEDVRVGVVDDPALHVRHVGPLRPGRPSPLPCGER